MICKSCKAQNKDDSLFCEVCGARLPSNYIDSGSRRRESEEFRYEFAQAAHDEPEVYVEKPVKRDVQPKKASKSAKNPKAKEKEKSPVKSEKKPTNKINVAITLAVISGILLLLSVFSLLTGFGVIKNYTGFFEKETTAVAATQEALTVPAITDPVFEITERAESTASETATS